MIEVKSTDNLDFAKNQIEKTTDTSILKQIETSEFEIYKTELSDLLKSAKLNEYERISYAGI